MPKKKAYNFRDSKSAQLIREATDPRAMKKIAENIRNYDHREWVSIHDEFMYKGLRAKFNDPQAKGAQDFLIQTGDLTLGEASRNLYWGTGFHISSPEALNPDAWTGSNTIGQMLMDIRSKVNAAKNTQPVNQNKSNHEKTSENDDSFDVASSNNSAKHRWAIVLGDENIPEEIEEAIDQIPVKIKKLSKPNMKLSDIGEITKTCMLPKEEVDFAILHTRSVEWQNGENKDADTVYSEYIRSLSTISETYPNADYIISSIPLHEPIDENDEKTKSINSEITKLNRLLHKFGQDEQNVTFVDNSNIYISNEMRKSPYYQDDIHFSQEGSQILLDNLRNGLSVGVASSLVNIWSEFKLV